MSDKQSFSAQTWNSADYAANGRFVATMATDIVTQLNPQPGERILDAGCGDGALTTQLADSGADLLGVDASAAMVTAARQRGLQVEQHDLTELPFNGRFDAVFSNAALHWIPCNSQPAMLASLHRALKPGGRLVAEMGGQGNIAAIRTSLSALFAAHGLDSEALAASFYPSPEHFRKLLESAGFKVRSIQLVPRPTPLPGGTNGMRLWLETFRNGVLTCLPEPSREQVVMDAVRLLQPILCDPLSGNWTADYVRLRFGAERG